MRWYWASSGRLTESGNPTRELGNTAYFIQKHKKHKYLFWNGGEAAPFINFYLDYEIDTPQQQQKTEDKDKGQHKQKHTPLKQKLQMLRAFFRIRWEPRRAQVCMHPMTSGIPRSFRKPSNLLGTVPKAPMTIGIHSVLTL